MSELPCESPDDVVGHKTMEDGSHVPLLRWEADAILADCDAMQAKRAADMPTEQDAINVMFEAFTRLKELGWKEAEYCPKDGTRFQAIEAGSTGIHPCFYSGEWPKGYFMVGEGEWCGPSRPILHKLHPADEEKRQQRMALAALRFAGKS